MTSTVPVIRWGIIGAGDIAERVMAPAMRAAPHAELVAIMRRDRSAAAAFARRHDVPRVYGSVEDIVADPDIQVIYIATPVGRHLPDTLAAAAQGKHILCEKPMALSSGEGEQMRAACERAGIRFMMCFYQRFNARHRKIKQLLAEGTIGQVTAVRANFSGRSPDVPARWRHDRAQAGGGCYMDNASHCIDLLRFLFGDITAAAAFVDTLAARYAVEDSASSLLRLANGAHAVVTSYWSTGDPDEYRNSLLEIQGTEGTIISTPLHEKFSRGTLTVATQQGETVYELEQSTHYAVLEDFAVTIAEERTPAITASDGIAAMRVVEAVYESGRSGRLVQVA